MLLLMLLLNFCYVKISIYFCQFTSIRKPATSSHVLAPLADKRLLDKLKRARLTLVAKKFANRIPPSSSISFLAKSKIDSLVARFEERLSAKSIAARSSNRLESKEISNSVEFSERHSAR